MTAPSKHVWAALLVVYVVWGSTYFGIKIAVETMSPLLAAGSRFLTAAALLAAILAVRGTRLRVSRRELAASAVAGALLLALGVGLVHVAETRIDSSVAAMIAGTVPLQIIAMRLAAGDDPARATRLSTLAGLAGLVLVPLNEMIDITTTRTVAGRTHPPLPIFVTLAALLLVNAVLVGYGMAGRNRRSTLHAIGFSIVMAGALMMILDLEFPRIGYVRIDAYDQVLVDVRAGMR